MGLIDCAGFSNTARIFNTSDRVRISTSLIDLISVEIFNCTSYSFSRPEVQILACGSMLIEEHCS